VAVPTGNTMRHRRNLRVKCGSHGGAWTGTGPVAPLCVDTNPSDDAGVEVTQDTQSTSSQGLSSPPALAAGSSQSMTTLPVEPHLRGDRPPVSEYAKPKPDPRAFEDHGWSSDPQILEGSLSPHSRRSSPARPPQLIRHKMVRSNSLSQTKLLIEVRPISPGTGPVRHQSPGSNNKDSMTFHKNYHILGLIGRGNFSEVYEVLSKQNGKRYAVKKSLRPLKSRRDRSKYMQEIQMYGKLGPTCQHIIRYVQGSGLSDCVRTCLTHFVAVGTTWDGRKMRTSLCTWNCATEEIFHPFFKL